MLTKNQIKSWLATHQLKAKFGEKLISVSEIAKMVGVHRDTIYEAINGRMSEVTQRRLSFVIERIESELEHKPSTKLAHVKILKGEIKIGFGYSNATILRKL